MYTRVVTLPRDVLKIDEGFWNVRGSFKIAGVVDIGTHASLVRRRSGKYVLLDACDFGDDVREWLNAETRNGADLEAVIHLHPFHTLHVAAAHALFPRATHYGSSRHVERAPQVAWNPVRVDDPQLSATFEGDLAFTVPRGVDFVSRDPKVHFSSVLAIHAASKTLHVDDTVLYLRLPPPLSYFKAPVTRFHPTLGKALQRRPGAASEFRQWALSLIESAGEVRNLCAAHSAALLERDNDGASIRERLQDALDRVEGTLASHERAHG
jgi:hypothetical protein